VVTDKRFTAGLDLSIQAFPAVFWISPIPLSTPRDTDITIDRQSRESSAVPYKISTTNRSESTVSPINHQHETDIQHSIFRD
jgi:hypothetical protein